MSSTAVQAARQRVASLGQVSQQKAAETEKQYRDLVKRMATGKEEIAPEAIVADLERWGKDVSTFQRDVELYAERFDWARIAKTLPRAAQDYDIATEKQRVMNERQLAEFQAMQRRHHEEKAVVDAELRRTYQAFTAAQQAADNLRGYASGPILERVASLRQQLDRVAERMRPHKLTLEVASNRLQNAMDLDRAALRERPLDRAPNRELGQMDPVQAKQHQARQDHDLAESVVADYRREYDAFKAQLAEAEKELENPDSIAMGILEE